MASRASLTAVRRTIYGIAFVTVDGIVVQVHPDGRFEHRTFIPVDGKEILVEATDLAGLTSTKNFNLFRNTETNQHPSPFDKLNPLGKRVARIEMLLP